MSVLLELPNELCYEIFKDWIEYDFYTIFVLIDTVVRYNSHLKSALLIQFAFARSLNHNFIEDKIVFEANKGFVKGFIHMSDIPTIIDIEGVHRSYNVVNLEKRSSRENHNGALKFLNSCTKIDELCNCPVNLIPLLSSAIMSSLTAISVYSSDKQLEAFQHIQQHCKNLTTLDMCHFYNLLVIEDGVREVVNEIVSNNIHLRTLNLFATKNIIQILDKCLHMQYLKLYINASIEIPMIINMINRIPTLNNCVIKIVDRTLIWDRVSSTDNVISVESHYLNGSAVWTLYSPDDNTFEDFKNYATPITKTLYLEGVERNVTYDSVQLCFQKCSVLQMLKLFKIWFNCDELLSLLSIVSPTLTNVTIDDMHVKVSTVVKILQQCRNLKYCEINPAIDDSNEDLTLVAQLRTTLLEYPINYFKVKINFEDQVKFTFFDGLFAARNLNHYLNIEKCSIGYDMMYEDI